jgi:hypothetical protein
LLLAEAWDRKTGGDKGQVPRIPGSHFLEPSEMTLEKAEAREGAYRGWVHGEPARNQT